MHRRQFIKLLALETMILGLSRPSSLFSESASPQVAITIDDPNTYLRPLLSPQERNRAILEALHDHSDLKAALFVCGEKVESNLGKKLLRAWDEKGHILGNHSYSHFFYHSPEIDAETYIKDIQRGEAVVKEFSSFRRLFRFPYPKEGDTAQKRDAVRNFLNKHGYKI
jgi:hypothetical protein